MSKSKNALGRGLSALITEDSSSDQKKHLPTSYDPETGVVSEGVQAVLLDLDDMEPGRFQPRNYFDEEKLRELTESIKENGVLQPILVRPDTLSGKYQIIAGERRWRASRQAGLNKIPVVIKELSDKVALEVALIENIQRQSLTPIEEADGYKKLVEEFSYTQEQLAKGLGKSRSHIANMMRLLTLPDEIKDLINTGALTMGHARALVNAENPLELAHEIIRSGLSVRQAEKIASGEASSKKRKRSSPPSLPSSSSYRNEESSQKDDDLIAMEHALSKSVGLKVTISDSQEGGRVILHFNNLSELDVILQKLG